MDEDTLKRWMNLEIRKANKATVSKGRLLSSLVDEETPAAQARDGTPHEFDPDTLDRLYDALSPLARVELELPITFYLSHKAADNCYVADEAAVTALKQLGVSSTEPRDGKLWMSTPLARDFAREWPTIAQFLIT